MGATPFGCKSGDGRWKPADTPISRNEENMTAENPRLKHRGQVNPALKLAVKTKRAGKAAGAGQAHFEKV